MTKNNSYYILIIASLILSGCATQLKRTDLGTIVKPEGVRISTIQEVSVGDVMLKAGEYSKDNKRLEIKTFNVKDNSIVSVQHKKYTFTFSIPSGEYLLHSRNQEGYYYVSTKPFSGLKNTRDGYGGLFVPYGSSEATEFYWNWKPNTPSANQAKLLTPISGSIGKKILSYNESLALSYPNDRGNDMLSIPSATLTYTGVASGQIHFVYREFTKDGLARPAFTQEVNLDYKPNSTYAYKSALFKVYKADSTHISFELINPL